MCIDIPLFSANLDKIVSGGWLPLTLGLVMFTIMTTGRASVSAFCVGCMSTVILWRR